MRIQRIRLYPFAGVIDRTFEFKPGLNTLLGENEFGKSTLFNAVIAVLFIPVRPRKGSDDYRSIENYLPRRGGSEIRVMLLFESDSQSYILEKTWSTDPKLCAISLKTPSSEWKGEDAEQSLKQLLRLNRASWEGMLFIEQSSIHDTIQQLRSKWDSLDAIQSFMKDGDPFDTEGFVRIVREKLKQHESRWDTALHRPEGGRGIDNPWARDVGLILEAWYEKERCREKHQQILNDEDRIAKLSTEIHQIFKEKEELDAYITQGEPLLRDANRSLQIASEKGLVERQGNDLKKCQQEWVSAEAVLPGMKQDLERLLEEKKILEAELGNANKRATAADMLRRDNDVRDLERRLSGHKSTLEGLREIPEAVVQEAKACDKAVREARLRLEAQQLKATLESDSELKIQASIAGQAPRELLVQPGIPEAFVSPGSLSITHGSLSLRVVSGSVDVDELEATISRHQQRILELCDEYRAEDIERLIQKRDAFLRARSEIERAESDLKVQLGGRDLKKWKEELAELAGIPATRDIPVIQSELNARIPRIAQLGLEITGKEENVTRWSREHGKPEDLLEKVADLRAKWKRLVEEASSLQPLPEGHESPSRFIEVLQERQKRRSQIQESLSKLREERSGLQGRLAEQEFSAEEIQEKQQSAEVRYQHLLKHAQALRRILEVHESVKSQKSVDPFEKLGARIKALVHRLSGGRYVDVKFKDSIPVHIGNGEFMLESELLSKGMQGSLALAIRLAFAEVYLDGMDGFLMLDDPFTELDPARIGFAAEVLKEIGSQKQIIFFTCHPDHAKILGAVSLVADV